MFRYIIGLFMLMFVVGCKPQDQFPPRCIVQEFDEEKYADADYPVVRDAIYQIDLDNYNCFEQTALEMLKTPEKQALYEQAVQGYNEILWGINDDNKYVKGHGGDRTANIIYIPSRLRIQMQIDEFLRGKISMVEHNQIPEACQQYLTPAERNQCYDHLLAEYTEKYILDEYIPRWRDHANFKPEYTKTINRGTGAIRALYESVSNDKGKIERQLEAYYLELFHAYFEILSIYE